MLIANPIYDIVFKFLMEDIDLARRFLSVIINEDIIHLEVEAQEFVDTSEKMNLTLLRLDFKATIRFADNSTKVALIELQKSKKPYDMIRFRRYLGHNYAHRESLEIVSPEGKTQTIFKEPLPIITIYFFGFNLEGIDTPVMKVNREYYDVINKVVLTQKHAYVEQLTHDCFIIQIRRLKGALTTKLEKVLSLFNQKYIVDDGRVLSLNAEDFDDDLQQAIAKRLNLILDNDKLLRKMIVEDEYETAFADQVRLSVEQQGRILEQQDIIVEQKGTIVEQKGTIVEQKGTIVEQKGTIVEQKDTIAEQQQKLEEKDRLIQELLDKLKNQNK